MERSLKESKNPLPIHPRRAKRVTPLEAFWDKKEDLEASDKVAAQIRSQISQAAAAPKSGTVEIFEVAAQF